MPLQLVPYILMNGRAKEAIEYYKENLNAQVLFIQTFEEGPEEETSKMRKEELNLVSHSVLKIGEAKVMIADIIPELPFQNGNQVSICITCSDIGVIRQFYENLKKDGKVLIELNEIYFSPAYGMVTDKFGVTFQLYANRQ